MAMTESMLGLRVGMEHIAYHAEVPPLLADRWVVTLQDLDDVSSGGWDLGAQIDSAALSRAKERE